MNLSAEENDFPLFEFLYEINIDAIMITAIPKYRCTLKISFKKTTDNKTINMVINWNRGVILDISSTISALE
jgi:hypothetical protein